MTTSSGTPRPRFENSPFQPRPEPTIEQFVVDDRVCHDSYGLGRVVRIDPGGVTVNFGAETIRITTPFRKMTKL